jgi:probable rRNA maturation factor
MIGFSYIDTPILKFKKSIVKKCIKDLISNEGLVAKDISLVFCSDEHLLSINQQYLEHDFYTDIITFDYCDEVIISGDLFISVDRVIENASNNNVNFADELMRILFHGVLHLCGYKDKNVKDKTVMSDKEDFYLNLFKSDLIL